MSDLANKWLVLWKSNRRIGSIEFTESNLAYLQSRFHMSLIQKGASGTEHWNILLRKEITQNAIEEIKAV